MSKKHVYAHVSGLCMLIPESNLKQFFILKARLQVAI